MVKEAQKPEVKQAKKPEAKEAQKSEVIVDFGNFSGSFKDLRVCSTAARLFHDNYLI